MENISSSCDLVIQRGYRRSSSLSFLSVTSFFSLVHIFFGAKYTALGLEPVGEFDLASSGPFSAWLHPAASTIEPTSPASPSLPGEKIARSRADDGILRQSPRPLDLSKVLKSCFHNAHIMVYLHHVAV